MSRPEARECLVQIKTRAEDLDGRSADPPSTKLGGVTLWGERESSLVKGIDCLKETIERVAKGHLSVTRQILKKLVRESLQLDDLDDRLFSAVLGATLRIGRMDSLTCGSKNDKPFRVFVHVSQFDRWRKATDIALSLLQTHGSLTVRDLERAIFGARAYNTWSSTSHVLAELNYRGTVEFVDDDTVRIIEGLLQW